MRIAQIVPSLETRHGGPSKSVYELSRALAREGHDVDLLATGPDADEFRTEGRLRIAIYKRDWPKDACASSGLRTRLRGLEADVVQHHALWLRTLHYARQCAERSGASLVISPRGMMTDWAWRHNGWKKKLARRFMHPGALEAARGWHVTSQAEAGDVAARGFRQPVCIAPNGVESPGDGERAAAIERWRERCPECARQPVALFYSRFHRKKRVLELIDLWAERGPKDWLLLIVGIPEGYGVEQLEDYVLRSNAARRVRIFSGRDEPPPYAVASLFLLPSHSENFGMSVAEALACGVPALVTDTTPWLALNTNGGGWCVPWEEYPAALTAALAEGSRELSRRGAAAREWVLREFSWEKPARALIQFYEHLKTSGSPAGRT